MKKLSEHDNTLLFFGKFEYSKRFRSECFKHIFTILHWNFKFDYTVLATVKYFTTTLITKRAADRGSIL